MYSHVHEVTAVSWQCVSSQMLLNNLRFLWVRSLFPSKSESDSYSDSDPDA